MSEQANILAAFEHLANEIKALQDLGGGGNGDQQLDGGNASATYGGNNVIDCGGANG
jgi:hypothetical protein